MSCETLERHSHPKCRVLPLHCQEAPNSPSYRTMLHKDDSNYTSIAQIIGDTHRGKTNYFLKLYLNFIPLQAVGRFHVGCSRVQLVSPCLTVVLGRSASEQGAWPMDLQVQQVPCPVENIRSTSKYTILFREEKLWFWHRFEEGLHKIRQMRTLTANLAKLIPNKSFHGRSGACKCCLGPGWWNPHW